MNREEYLKFKEERVAAGKLIDPKTADFFWCWAQVADPYGVHEDFPKELDCIGREYFLRAPGSDIWVCIDDLPDEARDEVRRLMRSGITKTIFSYQMN
jgi:hypothetical protein